MAAPTLTTKEVRKTVRATQEKKRVIRNVLQTPYTKTWPILKPDAQIEILETLKKIVGPLDIGRLSSKVRYPEELKKKKEKNLYKKKILKEQWEKGRDKRKFLSMGINVVTKRLEKNELCALLVNNDVSPSIMTQHLISLSIWRQIPAIAVNKLGQTLSEALHLKSCSAFGLMREVEHPENIFHEIYLKVKKLALPLPKMDEKLSFIPVEIPKTQGPIKTENPTEKLKIELDISSFYIYKNAPNYKKFRPTKQAEDFLSLETETPLQIKVEIQQKSSKPNSKATNYKSANIRLMQSSGKIKKQKFKKGKKLQ